MTIRELAGQLDMCLLCQQQSLKSPRGSGYIPGLRYVIDCRACGKYSLSEQAIMRYDEWAIPNLGRTKVAAYSRASSIRRGLDSSDPYPGFVYGVEGLSEVAGAVTVQDVLAAYPKTVSDRINRALLNISRLSGTVGRWVPILKEEDYPLVFADSPEGLGFMLWQMADTGFLYRDIDEPIAKQALLGAPPTEPPSKVVLTSRGWTRVAELEQGRAGERPYQAFVAMWFGEEVQTAYADGIAPAIREAGYDPLRIDMKQHNNMIDDEIIAEIRKSRFVVADFTGHRKGAYFEAGFGLGLGLPVIWTVHESDMEDTHFDTRQYNHIVWSDPSDLRAKLRARIEATIGVGRATL